MYQFHLILHVCVKNICRIKVNKIEIHERTYQIYSKDLWHKSLVFVTAFTRRYSDSLRPPSPFCSRLHFCSRVSSRIAVSPLNRLWHRGLLGPLMIFFLCPCVERLSWVSSSSGPELCSESVCYGQFSIMFPSYVISRFSIRAPRHSRAFLVFSRVLRSVCNVAAKTRSSPRVTSTFFSRLFRETR